jgi:hypothetical protein
MSYTTGGIIQATDYNTFATLANGINEVFADSHPGAVRNAGLYPVLTNDPVTYGYGQTALTSVTAGAPVLASEWANLFQTFARTGQHQNTTVVPPLPGTSPGFGAGSTTLPAIGNNVVAYSGVSTLLNTLRTNRLLLSSDVTQYAFTAGTGYASASPWTNTLTWTASVNFGSWNNARYFFNSGGFLGINGSWPSASTPVALAFRDVLVAMSPLRFNYLETTANTGTGATAVGFYDLTTSYQNIYNRMIGSMYYATSYVRVQAKLNAAAGTNGIIDFRIIMQDDDTFPDSKTGAITFSISNTRSIGGVVYPGSVSVTNGGFVYA